MRKAVALQRSRVGCTALARVAATLVAVFVANGCREEHVHVKYDVPVPVAREFAFRDAAFGNTNLVPERFTPPVPADREIAFSGNVKGRRPKRDFGLLYITKMHLGKRVKMRSAKAILEGKPEDDSFSFHATVAAPRKAGRYDVEVKIGEATVAVGEITVVVSPSDRDPASHPF